MHIKFKNKNVLLCFLMLLSLSFVNAQQQNSSTPPLLEEEGEIVCGFMSLPLILLKVSVWSNRNRYLKNLTLKNFEIYEEKKLQEIEFFSFDDAENQYSIGFFQDDTQENEWRNVKVELTKKKDFGDVLIDAPKGYFLKKN